MPRLRLGLGALFAAVATLVAMVCLPAVASAAVNISILSAGPDSTGNPYDLTVVADDGNGLRLTSAAAHVFNSSNQELPGSPYSMSYVSGAPSAQTWAATTPIPQADLPPGTYTVTVDASDAFPETDPGLPAPASFSFSYTTKMTVTANPPTVTQGSQNVTFTGTVTGVAPGGTPVGLANVPVNLAGAPGNPVATTASDGSFTCPASTCQATGITQTTTYAFSVAADPGGTYSAASSSVTVSAQQATTAISVTANPTSVSEGSPGVMFTGNVTVTPQGSTTTTGIGSAVPVDVSINGVSVGQVLTSDASGDFTYSADPISATTTYTFSVAATPLYTGVSSSVIIQANQAQTAIAVTPSPAFVTLGSQAVTFSGTVTALPPGGTTAVPVPGADVFVNGGTTRIATTDSSGRFTYQVSGISQSTSYTFSVNQANLYSAATDQVTIPLDPAHTEMIATANPADVHLGSSTVIFSGTVTVTPAGGSTAGGIGSGVPVDLSVNGRPATQVTTTDDAKGDFTDKITGITKAADYNFSVNAAPFWSAATADVPIGLQQLAANLVVTPGRVSVTEGSQSVTFSGVLSGTVPGSTVVVDIPNAPVYLDGGTTKIATTDKNGAFHYVIGGISKASSFNFSVTGTPTTYSNATDDVPIGSYAGADPDHRDRHIASAVEVRREGHAYWHRSVPERYVLDAPVRGCRSPLRGQDRCWHRQRRQGRLLQGNAADHSWRRMASHRQRGGAVPAGVRDREPEHLRSHEDQVLLRHPRRARQHQGHRLPAGNGAGPLWAGIEDRDPVRRRIARPVEGTRQTSAPQRRRRPRLVPRRERVVLRREHPRQTGERLLSRLLRRLTSAFQRTVSSVIHAWRYQTKITNYKVTPHAISTGGKVRISGRLWVRGKSWKPYGKRKVDIIYNEKGTSYWAHLGKPLKTSAGGYFSEIAVGSSGKFVAIIYAFYPGSKTDLAVESNGVAVAINEGSTSSPAPPPPPTPTSGRLPVIGLPTYRGLGMLAQDAVDIAAREIRALAFWPR